MAQESARTDRRVPIEDPDFYLRDPWPTFAWMRAEAPVYYYEPLDTFVLTRHKDIRDAAARAETFVSSRGIFLNDVKYQSQARDQTVTDSFFPKGGEQVGTTDPPRQQELRRVLLPAFSVSAIERMRKPLTEHLHELLGRIRPGDVVDWVPAASSIPIRVSTVFLGVPDADHERVAHWSDELEKLGGEISFEELQAAASDFQSLQEYIIQNIEAKKASGSTGEDLLSVLLAAELDNDKLTQANVVMFAMTALAAGSDTSRALLAGLVHCLAQHPEQWTRLREDRSLVQNAIEETLRWVTPARAFLRTASQEAVVHGQPIKEGQHVYFMYMAANRDGDAFRDADRFDITRPDASRHLAFGAGPHLCAGMRLIRFEARIVLNALLDRYARIELASEAVPVRHVIRNSWTTMPVVFHP